MNSRDKSSKSDANGEVETIAGGYQRFDSVFDPGYRAKHAKKATDKKNGKPTATKSRKPPITKGQKPQKKCRKSSD